MTAPCRTCGCDPYHPRGHFSNQSGLCHAEKGRLECKCGKYVPQPDPKSETEGREMTTEKGAAEPSERDN